MGLIKDSTGHWKDTLHAFADELSFTIAECLEQRRIHHQDIALIVEPQESARDGVEYTFHQIKKRSRVRRVAQFRPPKYSLIIPIVSSGWLICGQCPVACMTRSELPARCSCR